MHTYSDSTATLVNSIIWGPSAAAHLVGPTTVNASLVQGGYSGTGNLDADPRFVDAAAGNLRLQADSPAIDAGNNGAVPTDVTTDLDGGQRVADGTHDGTVTVDMGAYEQTYIYVDQDATGTNTGTSWADAFTDLQAALSQATNGDAIWVAAGTYTPHASDRSVSFALVDGVAVYGGFAGTETSRDQRDWRLNETILSGDIGTPGTPDDNSYRVVFADSVSSRTVLDGVTVRDALACTDPTDDATYLLNNSGKPALPQARSSAILSV